MSPFRITSPLLSACLLCSAAVQATDGAARPGDSTAPVEAVSCRASPDVAIQLLHSMYPSKEAAEAAYAAITTEWANHLRVGLFAEAMTHSIDAGSKDRGGDLGYIRRGELELRFENAVFALPAKTLSKPIQSSFGWHLVWIDNAKDVNTGTPCAE